jgi:hypothetical protein
MTLGKKSSKNRMQNTEKAQHAVLRDEAQLSDGFADSLHHLNRTPKV